MHDIEAAARGDDLFARELIASAAVSLGWGIVSLGHLLNPEIIVFGGGLLALKDLLIEPAITVANQHLFRQHQRDLRFATAVLAENAGILGAAALASDLLKQAEAPV